MHSRNERMFLILGTRRHDEIKTLGTWVSFVVRISTTSKDDLRIAPEHTKEEWLV